MSILAKKSEPNNLINTEEKNNNFLEITEYKENLEFEVLETFSEKISDFIGKNVPTSLDEVVHVRLMEDDALEEVIIEK